MRMAWPELIVLIVFTTLVVIGVEFAALDIADHCRVPAWIIGSTFLAMLLLDLWALLRLIDWAFAGPARRSGLRVL